VLMVQSGGTAADGTVLRVSLQQWDVTPEGVFAQCDATVEQKLHRLSPLHCYVILSQTAIYVVFFLYGVEISSFFFKLFKAIISSLSLVSNPHIKSSGPQMTRLLHYA